VAEPTGTARAWPWATAALTLGALGAAVALAPPAGAPPGRALAWLLFVGSSVHVASTGWLYTRPEVRAYAASRPVRYVWVPLALVALGAPTAAALSPAVMTWLVLVYFGWQFFHFAKQNLGMSALAASARRVAPLRPGERHAVTAAGAAGVVGLLARPGLLQLGVRPPTAALFAPAALAFAGAVGWGLVSLTRRPPGERPAAWCAVYLAALVFSLPVFVFGSPYAAVSGMTIAHGLQYLVLTGLVAAGTGRARTGRPFRIAALAAIALLGGILLAGASHLHRAGPPARLLFGAYLGAVMAHFVVDAGLWRLRDPFPRRFLAGAVPSLVPPPAPAPVVSSSADIR
jgi:hypothetical protein